MDPYIADALAEMKPLTASQTARITCLVDGALDDYADLLAKRGRAQEQQSFIVVVASRGEQVAELIADVLGLSLKQVDLALADFVPLVGAFITRLIEVNEPAIRTGVIPAFNDIAAQLGAVTTKIKRAA